MILGWPRMPRNPAFLCKVWVALNSQAFSGKKRLGEKQSPGAGMTTEREAPFEASQAETVG